MFPDENDLADILIADAADIADAGQRSNISQTPISKSIEGEPGAKICKIEWKNVAFVNEIDFLGTNFNRVSFQVWLYEGSDIIEIRFGPVAIKSPDIVHGESAAPGIAFVDGFSPFGGGIIPTGVFTLDGPSGSPTVQSGFNNFNYYYLDNDPAEGTVYRFVPLFSGVSGNGISSMQVYPNPTTEVLTVMAENLTGSSEAAIYNILGQQVLTLELRNGRNEMDVSTLYPGAYVLQIAQSNYALSFVKE